MKKMSVALWKDKECLCTGCGLCAQICPEHAIKMKADGEGFLFPQIDTDKCTDCGKCLSGCPRISSDKNCGGEPKAVYACQAKDPKILVEATAGGLFPVMAKWIIHNGGVVFGAAYDENMKVVHRGAYTMDEVAAFNGSKYVQSDCTKALQEAVAILKEGKKVLFSGTPCQIAALLTLCSEADRENLFTIDVVCYGVPSPGLFRAYLDAVEAEGDFKVTDFRFRDKHTNGWSHTTVIRKQYADGREEITEQIDHSKIPYYKMFGTRNCFRRSCYDCKYNTLQRVSDITTGNFWGIENISKAFDTYMGVSMALLNTEKGVALFEAVRDELFVESRSLEDAVQANDALVKGSVYPKQRDAIYRLFRKEGFQAQFKKYYTDTWWKKVRFKISILKHKLIKVISSR